MAYNYKYDNTAKELLFNASKTPSLKENKSNLVRSPLSRLDLFLSIGVDHIGI